jgi:hypothetical protein
MNTPARRELIRSLDELAAAMPEVRIGQLIANLAYAAKGPTQEAVWEVQDEELLAAARAQLKRQLDSRSSVA